MLSRSARLAARAVGVRPLSMGAPVTRTEDMFAANSFSIRAQRTTMPKAVFEEIQNKIRNHQRMDSALAEHYASAVLTWAMARGATHFTHWFMPLTGRSAQKHDAFIKRTGDHVISEFSAKTLLLLETDGSSFPSGGLRETHCARGYTVWDPSSPPFIVNHGSSSTLYIPAVFLSWKGHALDEKLPLIYSEEALQREALKCLTAAGIPGHNRVHCDSGIEQEFFLIDRDFYIRRPDLVQTGRTVLGAAPPKGQALSDQYFGDLSERTMLLINDAERELWRLGIAQVTRHKEVAPGQYEMAPHFSSAATASDQNVLTMEVVNRVAHHHGMEALFHEKPFARLNGSGKHNNWSVGSNLCGTFFEPGDSPQTNTLFMLFMAATLRAVDVHADVVRASIASCANDNRLGGHEAPPAIISAYLGDHVNAAVEQFIKGNTSAIGYPTQVRLGTSVPTFEKHTSDRNRTSPFAFTGNKFEFRAVGASMTPHRSNYVLNTILAESLSHITSLLTKKTGGAPASGAVLNDVIRGVLKDHSRIIFNGNAYDPAWHAEAAKLGMPILKTTPAALAALNSEKNRKLFSDMKVLSPEELDARTTTWQEEYVNKVEIESRAMESLVYGFTLPAGYSAQTRIAGSVAATGAAGLKSETQVKHMTKMSKSIDGVLRGLEAMSTARAAVQAGSSAGAQAAASQEKLLAAMKETRVHADEIEASSSSSEFTLPSYHDMLFTGHCYDVKPTGSSTA